MTNHCTFKQAIALKEIGFDESVRDVYNKNGFIQHGLHNMNYNQGEFTNISAPTRSEVLQWAREKKGIHGVVLPNDNYTEENPQWWIGILGFKTRDILYGFDDNSVYHVYYPTHPEAESALVDKIIEILKEQKA